MFNKLTGIENAIAKISDGSSIMVGGFGSPGTPFSLINELLNQGQKNLTIIKNDANEVGIGITKLIDNGQVDNLITTHIGLNQDAIQRMNDGHLNVSFFPQGILAEKIRTAAAGNYGFLSDIGIDTEITNESEVIIYQGRRVKIESSLHADFAFIHAYESDYIGNLSYYASAINFNPIMAMAANCCIVESANMIKTGDMETNKIHTPSIFINHVVQLDQLDAEYGVMQHHV
ncbi:MAG: CoA transferase subunit A [Ostreibacterium sp.]